MSAGQFDLTLYESDLGSIHLIRLQPETVSTLDSGSGAQTAPTGPATSPFWAKKTRGSNEYGLRPRCVNLRWTGTPPTGYDADEVLGVTVLQDAYYAAITIGQAITYLGAAAQVVGKVAENIYPGI